MFDRIFDKTESALILGKIVWKRYVADPVKEALTGDDGISELVQGLLIAGIVVVLVIAAFNLLKPGVEQSAQNVNDKLMGNDLDAFDF